MTRQLVLLRHAHAEPGRMGGNDFVRTLSERGRQQLSVVAPAIAKRVSPDKVIASAAVRTTETARALLRAADMTDAQFEADDALYEVPSMVLYERLLRVDEALSVVAFVLHNPGVSDLAQALINGPIRPFEPADFAVIRFNCGWSEITHGSGTLDG